MIINIGLSVVLVNNNLTGMTDNFANDGSIGDPDLEHYFYQNLWFFLYLKLKVNYFLAFFNNFYHRRRYFPT
jgi:hypothetical protein